MDENNSTINLKIILNEVKILLKYLIASYFLILLIAFIFLYNQKDSWVGTIDINHISLKEESKYNKLNLFSKYIANFPVIEKYNLRLYLIEELNNVNILSRAFQLTGIISEKVNEDDYAKVLEQNRRALQIQPLKKEISLSDKVDENIFYRVYFSNEKKKNIKNFLDILLSKANENVSQNIIENLEEFIRNYEIKLSYDIEDIDVEIKKLGNKFLYENNMKIEFLKEQAEIARILNIETNSTETNLSIIDESELIDINTNPYYLRGYKAIEEEIKLVSARKNPYLYSSEINALRLMKNQLLDDNSKLRVEKALLSSPLQTKEFVSASYDLQTIIYNNTKFSSLSIIFTALLLCIALTILLIILSLSMRKS